MRIALFGDGRMGRIVASQARAAGDEVVAVFDSRDAGLGAGAIADALHGVDVAIDFSVAGAVRRNAEACAVAGTPLVEGTTGWTAEEPEVLDVVCRHGGALVYGANFSVGANLFFRLVERAGELFGRVAEFAPFVEEAHHAAKRDAPSGTALRLRSLLETALDREIPVASTRAGHIPGVHRVGFDAPAEQILLTHEARSREGFASGALLAARWVAGRRGISTFADVIDSILDRKE